MPVRVTFRYDEPTRKWETTVEGAKDPNEAADAFAAVVATCRQLPVAYLHLAIVQNLGDKYAIIPAV